MKGQKGFYLDTSMCTGCKTCSVACKDRKNQPMGVNIRKVYEYGGGGWVKKDDYLIPSDIFTRFVSASCMHCGKPKCIEVCPESAITKRKEDGAVIIHREKCIGCGSCLEVCPYKAPSLDKATEKMFKCDFCADLIEKGQNPVCVDACLQRCLKFGDIDMLKKTYGNISAVEPIPATDTEPSMIFTVADYTGGKTKGRIRNKTEV